MNSMIAKLPSSINRYASALQTMKENNNLHDAFKSFAAFCGKRVTMATVVVCSASPHFATAQSLHIIGDVFVSPTASLHAVSGLDVTSANADLSVDGHLIISGSVSGEANIELGSTAHLDLRTTAEYAFSDKSRRT